MYCIYVVVCVVAARDWWGYCDTQHSAARNCCTAQSQQSLVSSTTHRSTRIQFHPRAHHACTQPSLHCCTPPQHPASNPADHIWNIQTAGFSDHHQGHYQRHLQQVPAMSHHVTHSLPVLPRPPAHAWSFADQCRLYADDDYRRLAYEQGDMRPGGVAFPVPVPVETPFNHGERGCGDLSRRRVQYSNAAVEKLLSLQHARTLPAVCTRRFLSLLFSSKVP